MGASAAAAVVVARERRIVDAFSRAGATTPDRAATPDSLGVSQRLAFRILVKDAVLREAEPGFYYLDEPSWIAKQGIRRRVALVAALMAVVMLIGLSVAGLLRING